MPRQLAYDMAAQTVLGSARLMQETKKHPGELKDMVCSPAGTTICGVKALQEGGMHAALMDAIDKCVQRSKQI
jgi:pyrroline-5-carboxylate reductase